MSISQANWPMQLRTPLGGDALFPVGFSGQEALSRLYRFQVDCLAPNKKPVPFHELLGQPVGLSFKLPNNQKRHFGGICVRVSEGGRDEESTSCRLELVPQFWLLTKKAQSRIFQQTPVPEILKKVLTGLDVVFDIQGTFHPRDYCVQYRETDFNFACRMMEEEGIYYYFKHAESGQQMVVTNAPPSSMPEVPGAAKILYDQIAGGNRPDARINGWDKEQELRAGKYLLWDHCFELPHKHLEADKAIQESVKVGSVDHKLKIAGNEKLELFDWPGAYAQRFDGVNPSGGDRPADIDKIFEDNKRAVALRMQEEALGSVEARGSSNCQQLTSGHRFTLERHFNADGEYYVNSVSHQAHFLAAAGGSMTYGNTFTCLPSALPYRPPRITPKPLVGGSQTAVVVGPKGEEIMTDKYGRVKVQFHWDREGKNDANSSCWVRVGQLWAGKRWGASFWPRIGQEVIVDFLEGDPDQPIIVGSVYNADQMPPYLGQGPDSKHPKDNKVSGIKSNTTPGGVGFNEWRFDDTKDKQQIFVHAERNMDTRVKNDSMELVLRHRHLIVGHEKDGKKEGDQREQVFKDKHLHVQGNQHEHIEGNMFLLVKGKDGGNQDIVIDKIKKELIREQSHLEVKKDRCEKIGGGQSLTVGGDQHEKVGANHALEAGQNIHVKAGINLILEAGAQLTLKVGGNFIDISPAGIAIQGTMVMINSGGAAGAGTGAKPAAPQEAKEAAPLKPDLADDAKSGQKSAPA